MKLKTDNAIFQFISMTCDFIALNICFLICCIPVITIGPALSALFTVTLKEAKGEHGYLIRPFFAAWKENLKTVTVTWLIQLGAGAVLLFNVIFWYNSENSAGAAMAMIILSGHGLVLLSIILSRILLQERDLLLRSLMTVSALHTVLCLTVRQHVRSW